MPGTTLSRPTMSARDAACHASIAACMASLGDAATSTLIIVPSFAQQRHAVAAWATHTTGGRPPVVMTLQSLISHLADAVLPDDVRRIDDTEAAMLLDLAAEQVQLRPGGLGVDVAMLHRFVMEGHTARSVAERLDAGEWPGRASRRIEHLVRLWTSYDAMVAERGIDRSNLLRAVILALRDHGTMTLRVRDLVEPVHAAIVRDVVSLSALEADLVTALVGCGWDVAVRWAAEPAWDTTPDAVAARFAVHDGRMRDRSRDLVMRFVGEGWIHLEDAMSRQRPRAGVHMARTPADEVRHLLTAAKTACFDHGMRPDEICIVVPRQHVYEAALRDLGRRAGIPLTGGERIDLAATNPGQAVLTACDVIGDGWRRADVDRLRRCDLPADVAADLHDIVMAAEMERIPGGHGPAEWHRRFVHRMQVLRAMPPDADDRDTASSMRTIGDALDALPRCATILPVVADAMTAESFASVITDTVIRGLGIERSASDRRRMADAAMRPCADAEAVHMLVDLAHRYAHVMTMMPVGERTFAQHLHAYRRMVLQASVNLHDVRIDGIAVVRPAETRGRTWRLVLSPGWVEGAFPATPRPERVEELLLPDQQAQADLETFIDIVRCVDPERGHLLVTWPAMVDESEMLASTFCDAMRHGTTIDAQPLVDPAVDHVLCDDEVRLDDGDGRLPTSQLGFRIDDASASAREAFEKAVQRRVSPTRMDAYVACPYQYFASKLLGISATSSDEDRMTPLERGELMHAIAHRLFRELRRRQHGVIDESDLAAALRHPIDLSVVPLVDAIELLETIADDVIAHYDSGHTYQHAERRVLLGTEREPGLLQRWIAMEIAHAGAGAPRPAAFEMAIAVDVPMPDGTTVPIDVRVDRIDIDTSANPHELVVIDYKNTHASIPSIRSVAGGERLQMPMYVLAVDALCASMGMDARVRSAQYMPFGARLHDKEAAKRVARLHDPERLLGVSGRPPKAPIDAIMSTVTTVLATSVERMRAGDLRVAPLDGACDRCTFNELCRIDVLGPAEPLPQP